MRHWLLSHGVTAFAAISLLSTAACTRGGADDQSGSSEAASLSMLFAGEGLAGEPNLYELQVESTPGALPIARAGDLPTVGQVVTIGDLPAADAALISGGLYRNKVDPSTRTHTCKADAPVALVAGRTVTAALTCTEVVAGNPAVKVFVKVARASLTLTEQRSVDVLATRDWSQDALFASTDDKGRRVSFKQNHASLTLNVGGDLTYIEARTDTAAAAPVLERLLAGESIDLIPVSGHLLQIAPEAATLKLNGTPLLYEDDEVDGGFKAVLDIALQNATGNIAVTGRLLEEAASSEFTVVSYNVENLFDQIDEVRNATYGDYRLAPNAASQSSNYGQPVELNGQTMSFTDVKIAGIRKTLLGIDPTGPAVVGLVEVESRAAVERLLEAVKDLGYTAVQFTDWPADTVAPAIGQAVLTKFPIRSTSLVTVTYPTPVQQPGQPASTPEPPRPILKVELDVLGHPLTVYVNHWKSKGGPESMRIACAQALQADIDTLLAVDPKADFLILGDLNSDYNETVIMADSNNDTNRVTGINNVIKAQGDELAVLKNTNPSWKYNLSYELERGARKTAWHEGFGWSSMDHIIVGSGVYDRKGITYVDNSFEVPTPLAPALSHLFKADGTTNRWRQVRNGLVTTHEVGGYSDHLPVFARFHVPARQGTGTIWLGTPGKPDATDPRL